MFFRNKPMPKASKNSNKSRQEKGSSGSQTSINERTVDFLTENVLCQRQEHAFSDLYQHFDPQLQSPSPYNIVHIVNFFTIDGKLDSVQRATIASMQAAAKSEMAGIGKTVLVQVSSPEDVDLHLNGFVNAKCLDRDIQSLSQFGHPRPLPLLFDILEKGSALAGPEDIIIYTNADICLQPHFYGSVRQLHAAGFDALTINRREIGDGRISNPDALTLTEVGEQHRGFDCFVFTKASYDKFTRSDSCLGISAVARPLLFNMVAHSKRMLMLKNVNLTYHFGNDRSWSEAKYDDYLAHNQAEAFACLKDLGQSPAQRSRLRDFCNNHPEQKNYRELINAPFG